MHITKVVKWRTARKILAGNVEVGSMSSKKVLSYAGEYLVATRLSLVGSILRLLYQRELQLSI